MIKNRLFIMMSLVLSLAFVKFIPLNTSTPYALSNSFFQALVPNNLQQQIAKRINSQNHNEALTKVAQFLSPKSAQAKEKRVILYKGKKLEIYTYDKNEDLNHDTLEFFYQAQLRREQEQLNNP